VGRKQCPQELGAAPGYDGRSGGSDLRHSSREKRYYALGQTRASRRLFVAFTIRRKLIRVISVRDMNRNEASAYERLESEII
jgi:uncharacterized DUF497 family protein